MQVKKEAKDTPIRYVKGVGPVKANLFERIGVENVSDLFYYLPRRYEDRTLIVDIKDAKVGEAQGVEGTILKTNSFRARTGTYIFDIVIGDGKNKISAVWYNQPYMGKILSKGQKVVLYGKLEKDQHLVMTHPAYEVIDEEKEDKSASLEIGRIVPFYSLTESLNQREIRKVVSEALSVYSSSLKDYLPTKIRARKKLVDAKFAVTNIHFPHSEENLERAYKRLIFEEFFLLQVVMALRRKKLREKGIKHEVERSLFEDFQKLFSFNLTTEQKKCIKEIEQDMAEDKPMYRLLQGDVGSGKTVVAMYALLLTCQNAHQGVLMAPTEILARQHYVTVSKTLMPLGMNVRLLVSGMDQKDKETVRREISSGEADIVIGTHALLEEGIDFKDLGLVVIDEQHKFGVEQRKVLKEKGPLSDVLFMTATPIPRSLVLTFFGDMDISTLKEKPEGREAASTYWVGEEKREAIYSFLRSEIGKGRQAFIVYPRIKKAGSLKLKSAEEEYELLKSDIFKDLRVALIHGRMKTIEKDKIMEKFRKGEYDILVATTVIEVGVDIPNVSVMLVEHPERYGLAQLHQLRGRIGRGKHPSYCILLGEAETDSSSERLEAISSTTDGFSIAEKDLDIRGPGELLGTRQSGLPELRFGNIARDFSIMEEARLEAFSLVKEDPSLLKEQNAGVKAALKEMFKGKLEV